MTKEVKYICNICREHKEPSKLYGIYFTATFEFRAPMDCETHICLGCADQIVHLIAKQPSSALKPKA